MVPEICLDAKVKSYGYTIGGHSQQCFGKLLARRLLFSADAHIWLIFLHDPSYIGHGEIALLRSQTVLLGS
eukprot:1469872-Amphidinium_carterae.1